ncbi:hypothetical protein [Streptomyces sp. MMS24-I29]|uniref:hypothetical protein n=1 Tax=Streptomyces sp. MMS24-I29 TaxID=3351480 RepID=UPI003C7CC911
MVVSLSAVILLGIIVFALFRGGYVRAWSALACAGFGFTLASTGIAPAINNGLASLAGLLSSL